MSTTDQNKTGNGQAKNQPDDKFNIAKYVLIFGLTAVSILGIVAIILSAIPGTSEKAYTNIRDILTMLLPLIGAWVGTVLAFYFSKDNFKAAAESTKQLFQEFRTSEEKLKTIRVGDVMIKEKDIKKLVLTKPEDQIFIMKEIIADILESNKDKIINRLPVVNDKNIPVYMIHRSLIDKFFVKMAMDKQDLASLTLFNMSHDPDFQNMLKNSFRTTSENSNLAEVKKLIDNIDICQDVFVTATGNPDSNIVGWITNVDIAKASEI